jgi:hypothetical protein
MFSKLVFTCLFFETWHHYFAQVGLKIQDSKDSSTSFSWVLGLSPEPNCMSQFWAKITEYLKMGKLLRREVYSFHFQNLGSQNLRDSSLSRVFMLCHPMVKGRRIWERKGKRKGREPNTYLYQEPTHMITNPFQWQQHYFIGEGRALMI